MTEPTRKEWLVNVYQSKLFAFITSGWLAVGVIAILLAIVYMMLKVSKETPIVEAPAVVVEQVTTVTPIVKKQAKPKPTVKESLTVEKPVKPVEPDTQFDRDLANFEKRIPQ